MQWANNQPAHCLGPPTHRRPISQYRLAHPITHMLVFDFFLDLKCLLTAFFHVHVKIRRSKKKSEVIESDFLMNNTNCFDESEIRGDRIHPFH